MFHNKYIIFYIFAVSIVGCLIGKVAVGSYKFGQNPGRIFVAIVQDELWYVDEKPFFIRPYSYYPNPAQNRLHLQYSPAVQPKQVELYDLQGHLIHTQNQDFDCLNMNGLAAGQYLMKVTLEDGKSFTDKVVKE